MQAELERFLDFLASLVSTVNLYVLGIWTDSLQWSEERYYDLLLSILIFVLYLALRRWLIAPAGRMFTTPARRYSFRKIANGGLASLALATVAILWVDTGGQDIVTFFGIIGAGLAVAMQDVIMNFLGWAFILIREPFSVKDRIEIGNGLKGDVIDVRLFMFSLLEVGGWVDAEQSTGRIVHVPNSVVFRQTVANYTQGFKYIWNEIPVTVTFESDWEKARTILTQIIEEDSKEVVEKAAGEVHETSTRFMVYYTRFTPIVWVTVADIGVTLTIRYLCDARRRRSSEHVIWSHVLHAFAQQPTIDFAYPTTRYYYNRSEGKPGAGGPPEAALRESETIAPPPPGGSGEEPPQEEETGEVHLPGISPPPPTPPSLS